MKLSTTVATRAEQSQGDLAETKRNAGASREKARVGVSGRMERIFRAYQDDVPEEADREFPSEKMDQP